MVRKKALLALTTLLLGTSTQGDNTSYIRRNSSKIIGETVLPRNYSSNSNVHTLFFQKRGFNMSSKKPFSRYVGKVCFDDEEIYSNISNCYDFYVFSPDSQEEFYVQEPINLNYSISYHF